MSLANLPSFAHSQSGDSPARLKSANWPIEQLPGLSPQDCEQLQAIGIGTTFHLLRQFWNPIAREALSIKLGVHLKYVHKWVTLADLARVPSVGVRHCGLVLHAGIATVDRLATMPSDNLHRQVLRLQVTILRRTDLCPSYGEVDLWIQQARALITAERQAQKRE